MTETDARTCEQETDDAPGCVYMHRYFVELAALDSDGRHTFKCLDCGYRTDPEMAS